MKEIGKYDYNLERLQDFIKGISSQSEIFSWEAMESCSLEKENTVPKETPAERLLMEKSESQDPISSPGDISQELAVYHKLSKPPMKETVLKFWKDNETLLPQLSKAACVTLSVPCASATVERTFKVGVHQVTTDRNRLNPKTVEGLVLAKANSGRVNMTGIEDENHQSESSSSDSSSDDDEDSQAEVDRLTQTRICNR